jgi:hypothetical protein
MQTNRTTLKEAIAEIDREMKTRARVYPKWIKQNLITEEEANKRTSALLSSFVYLSMLDQIMGMNDTGILNGIMDMAGAISEYENNTAENKEKIFSQTANKMV